MILNYLQWISFFNNFLRHVHNGAIKTPKHLLLLLVVTSLWIWYDETKLKNLTRIRFLKKGKIRKTLKYWWTRCICQSSANKLFTSLAFINMIEEFSGVIKLVWTMMVIAVKEDLDQRLEQFFANKHQFWRLWDKGRPSLFFDKKMNKVILKQYVYRNE